MNDYVNEHDHVGRVAEGDPTRPTGRGPRRLRRHIGDLLSMCGTSSRTPSRTLASDASESFEVFDKVRDKVLDEVGWRRQSPLLRSEACEED